MMKPKIVPVQGALSVTKAGSGRAVMFASVIVFRKTAKSTCGFYQKMSWARSIKSLRTCSVRRANWCHLSKERCFLPGLLVGNGILVFAVCSHVEVSSTISSIPDPYPNGTRLHQPRFPQSACQILSCWHLFPVSLAREVRSNLSTRMRHPRARRTLRMTVKPNRNLCHMRTSRHQFAVKLRALLAATPAGALEQQWTTLPG